MKIFNIKTKLGPFYPISSSYPEMVARISCCMPKLVFLLPMNPVNLPNCFSTAHEPYQPARIAFLLPKNFVQLPKLYLCCL